MPKVMASTPGSGGRARGRRVATSLAEINVIPLVDVMLVLLIVFMVAAPMLQKGIEVNLPVSQRADRMAEERLYVTVPSSYRTDRRVQIGEEFVRTQVLGERLRQAMDSREQKEVFLRGDGSVQLQDLTEVFGLLKAAGVERVGILTATPPPPRRR
jgi:biopolymer transport protein TolR